MNMSDSTVASLQVAELARAARVEPHVVRYYTRIGLLHPQRRAGNGYQLFGRGDLVRLRFIRRAQQLGYTLSEIRAILHDAQRGACPCPRVREILRRRIGETHRRLLELQGLQERMERALANWSRMPDRLPDGEAICHLIESLPDLEDGGT